MSERVDIGRFWDIVTIYACTISRSSEGAKVETYNEAAKVHASVDADIDEEAQDSNVTDYATIRVCTWRNSAINTRAQLGWNGRRYNVTNISPLQMLSPFVIVTAQEVK